MGKKFNIDFDFYKERVIEVMDTYPPPNTKIGTCLDVGANVGAFSLIFSFYCDKVIAIEPFKENYDYMVKKIEDYGIDNIIPINKAIHPSDGKSVEMSVGEENTDSKDITCIEMPPGTVSLGSVQTVSLESIIEEYGEIDYMKVDCEGCEWDLLYGKDLSKIKTIVTEIHGGFIGEENKVKLVDYLKKEYDFTYPYHLEYWPNFDFTEFVFRREGTPDYKHNIFIRFATLHPHVEVLTPECPNSINNWIRTCQYLLQKQ